MSGFLGMAPEQVREHSRQVLVGADRLQEMSMHLDALSGVAQWTGPDADTFRSELEQLRSGRIAVLQARLRGYGALLRTHAEEQDDASAADPAPVPPGSPSVTVPDSLAHVLSGLDPGLSTGQRVQLGLHSSSEALKLTLMQLGVPPEAFDGLQRDGLHLTGILADWGDGERVPAVAELGAAVLVAGGSGAAGAYTLLTGKSTDLMDARPGGIVHGVETRRVLAPAPGSLQELVQDNDALRLSNPGKQPLASGRIGITEVLPADGAAPVYIVQIPPTEGPAPFSVDAAYGLQGNSRDWGSNLRLVSGQHPAAMDDVRAALAAPGSDGRPLVPAGAQVMFVGHSQGGIVGAQLAADASFNSASGADGTYDVTHAVSVGSPVQTVLPAQAGTEVVNIAHGPPRISSLAPLEATGDVVAYLDLQGLQADGMLLEAENVHEVVIDSGYEEPLLMPWLEANHDSLGPGDDPTLGYAGTLDRAAAGDPVLRSLTRDLEGTYLGEGALVLASHEVDVGREHRG